jgi:hypothetical protein
MANAKTNALIIRHIADLDAAVRQLEEHIVPLLEKTIKDIVQEWAEKNSWVLDWSDWNIKDPFIYPPEWQRMGEAGEKPRYMAQFKFSQKASNFDALGGESYWTAMLCGFGGSVGFWWDFDRAELGLNKKRAKAVLAEFVEKLQQAGFIYDEADNQFFIPFEIKPEILAQAIEEDAPEEALAPLINAALDRCRAAKTMFEKILETAKARAPEA